ncbi:MAG TPA: penicillin-insensitive murein endopeptidase [Pseudolabrys sp.]|jgi:penicillin-insensitive murein endopeptidase|nr:penicillin-insensitive murein endopeptidase [Pseudolabrys sp.]
MDSRTLSAAALAFALISASFAFGATPAIAAPVAHEAGTKQGTTALHAKRAAEGKTKKTKKRKEPEERIKSEPAPPLFAAKELPSAGKPMAIGYYPRGCLQGGAELPLTGKTWQVMRPSRNRNWGHPELVKFIERFAPLAAKATGWNGILIGDMAQPRGGPLPYGHMSHQVGLDVDIWFKPMPDHVFTTEERDTIPAPSLVEPDGKHLDPKLWSAKDAAFIRTAAEQPEVERVLVNAAIKKELCRLEGSHHYAWMSKVRPWYGHNDHMHVRLKCPAGSPQCRNQPPVPAGDGCDKSLDYWFTDRVLHPPKRTAPSKPIMMSSLPAACRAVLNAPAKATASK